MTGAKRRQYRKRTSRRELDGEQYRGEGGNEGTVSMDEGGKRRWCEGETKVRQLEREK